MVNSIILILAALLAGCIPLRPDAETARLAQHEWQRIGGEPGTYVDGVDCIGSPAAVFWPDDRGQMHVRAFVPAGLPDWLRRAFARYELERCRVAMGRGVPLGHALQPLYMADAMLHGPVSLSAVWFDVLFAPEVRQDPPRESVFEGTAAR